MTRFRTSEEPPSGADWGRYVELLVDAHGGWRPLVDTLIHRARESVALPEDPQTIERGIRRLADRGHAPGGQYGRWLIRFFGTPEPLMARARWMGQYHSRFSDLPVSMCAAQLMLWDRPPIIESRAAAWIHLGMAAVAMRRGRVDAAEDRLHRVTGDVDPDAKVEAELLAARIASDQGGTVDAFLDRASAIAETIVDPVTRTDYVARIADQRAYRLIHGDEPKIDEALAMYRSIPNGPSASFFASFRRAHGVSYCHYRRGELETARESCRRAIEAAGDAGLTRFRAMGLKLFARLCEDEAEAEEILQRARVLAATLEHEDLDGL